MNICPHCGASMNGTTVCPQCGADITSATTPHSDISTGKSSFLKKNIPQEKRKYVVAGFVALMVLLLCLSFLLPRKKNVILLTDYVHIDSVTGADGYGHLEYSFDSYSVYQKLSGMDVKSDKDTEALFSEENLLKAEKIMTVLEGVTVTADKNDNLSNGDKVTLIVSFDNPTKEKLDFELRGGEVSYTVEGLAEGLPFDPFSEDIISVVFTGASGSGEAIIGLLSGDDMYKAVTYSFSNNYNLSNGDEVVLTAVFDQQYFAALGYAVPDQCSKTYIVSGLKDFFRPSDGLSVSERTRFEDLTMSSVLDDIARDVLTKDMSVLDSEFWSLYYFEAKTPGTTFFDMIHGFGGHCGIMGIAKVVFESSWTGTYEDVYFVAFPDCMMGDDGHLTYDEENFIVFDSPVSDETEALDWLADQFPKLTFSELS